MKLILPVIMISCKNLTHIYIYILYKTKKTNLYSCHMDR